eukprot:Lithocolla_globosa_v1_NODE_3609_length_1623_cov_76.809949.p1 type:complete len:483 gc:universal NODE_3609_length_1623_cov_76.809949:48-1496(+)
MMWVLLLLTAVVTARLKGFEGNYVDEWSRVIILHGVNHVVKVEPFYSEITDEEMDLMALDLGFNVVRLGISWEGFERSPGVYDMQYLEATMDVIQRLGERGIYVFLDMHQDVYGRKYCGNGFPDWSVKVDPETEYYAPFPAPVLDCEFELDEETGRIKPEDCAKFPFWGNAYFTNVTCSIYQSFWDDVEGVQTMYVETWRQIAMYFAGNENVIGLEYMNEPWPGNIYTDPNLFIVPGAATRQHLQPAYRQWHDQVRTVDDDTMLFFEPCVSNTEGLPRRAGFTRGPGGPRYNDRQVYSYHYYCIEGGDPEEEFCEWFAETSFRVRNEEAEELGVPSMLSEWGCLQGTLEERLKEIKFICDQCDLYLESWAFWEWFGLRNNLEHQMALSRPYAMAVAGVPTLMNFNSTSLLFQLHYTADASINTTHAPTQLFLRQDLYPQGYRLVIRPDCMATPAHRGPNFVDVTHSEQIQDGTVLYIEAHSL